ncbi:MAG: hypothetical protein RR423_06305 [Hydrogenoanaerobacterium sp.]
MEMLNGWAAILSVIAVLSFAIYYPGYLKRSRGCAVFKLWRMLTIGVMEFFLMGINQDHPAYLVAILAAITVMVVVFFLNKRDANSWWQGILMTLWQSLIFIILVYVFIGISNAVKKKNG